MNFTILVILVSFLVIFLIILALFWSFCQFPGRFVYLFVYVFCLIYVQDKVRHDTSVIECCFVHFTITGTGSYTVLNRKL